MPRRKGAPNIQERTKALICLVKAEHPDFSASDIRRYLKQHHEELLFDLPEDEIPRHRAIQDVIREKAPKIKQMTENPVDTPWSIGSCKKYDINTGIISTLIELQKHHQNLSREIKEKAQKIKIKVRPNEGIMSIREAQWIQKLEPLIRTSELINKKYPGHLNILGVIDMIASQYAKSEQIAELMGEPSPDTTDLDDLYFGEGDADVIIGFASRFLNPEIVSDLLESKRERKEGAK